MPIDLGFLQNISNTKQLSKGERMEKWFWVWLAPCRLQNHSVHKFDVKGLQILIVSP